MPFQKIYVFSCTHPPTEDILILLFLMVTCPLEKGKKPLQYFCLENPMNSMKRQKDRTLKDELPRSVGAQYTTGDQGEITPERINGWSQSKTTPSCGYDW